MPLDIILIGFAFSAGVIAFLNPCGFALLPTYVSYFVERTTTNSYNIFPSQTRNINAKSNRSNSNNENVYQLISLRRLAVGALIWLLVTGAFVAIFGLTGLAISLVGTSIVKIFPWVAVMSGIIIIGIGIAKIFGKTIRLNIIPSLSSKIVYNNSSSSNSSNSINNNKNYNSKIPYAKFFLFGISYAIASLSCTLPIFLLVVFQGLSTGGIEEGSLVFLAYAFGMGIVMIALSVAISLSNQTFVRYLKKILPNMNIITSIVLILAGGYLIYYNLVIGKLLT